MDGVTIETKPQEQESIKLIRGQRGNYGWEIKLFGKDLKNRVNVLNQEMVNSYDLNIIKEDKK